VISYSKDVDNALANYNQFYMHCIQENAEMAIRSFLKQVRHKLGNRDMTAVDCLDNGTRIKITIRIREDGSADFDFSGTGPQVLGNNNAPKSICLSAIIYCLRCLVNEEIPLNQGCLASINVINPEGCILNPSVGAAVYAGNTQTAQRVVDVILRAFNVRDETTQRLCWPLTPHRHALPAKAV
jgi:5-oxoprolinase (ATP-hydrolysing)